MPDVTEIETLAIKSEMVPARYTLPEQLLFLSLRILHEEYRRDEITREQAAKEKARLLDQFRRAQQLFAIFQHTVEIRNTMSWKFRNIEKNGCPHCQELIKIFDGRLPPKKEDI